MTTVFFQEDSTQVHCAYNTIQLSEIWFSCFRVLPGSAEVQVIWAGTVKRLLIAYFIRNISAKKISKSIHVHQSYSKPKVGRFFEMRCSCISHFPGAQRCIQRLAKQTNSWFPPSRNVGLKPNCSTNLSHHRVSSFVRTDSMDFWPDRFFWATHFFSFFSLLLISACFLVPCSRLSWLTVSQLLGVCKYFVSYYMISYGIVCVCLC